jgi:hypothetical protein
MVVECRAGLDATDSSWMREILAQVRSSTWAGVVLDFSGLDSIDPGGRRMISNFHRGLAEVGRALEVVADRDGTRNAFLADNSFPVLQDLSELKRSIHEMAPERLQSMLAAGVRNSNLLGLRLRCPVCGFEDVRGWLPDPDRHDQAWLPHEITRQLVSHDPDNALIVDAYTVAVCPECLFAATRMDWFDSAALRLPATLPEGSVERLTKSFTRRRTIVQDVVLETPLQVFFGMPRLDRAVQCSWALAEESLRAVGRDRASTDGFGIGVALLMQAKFAKEGEDLERYFSASYVWLRQVVEQVGNYAEDRLAEASVYLLSVALALGRTSEAEQISRQIREKWSADPEMEAWIERARELVH